MLCKRTHSGTHLLFTLCRWQLSRQPCCGTPSCSSTTLPCSCSCCSCPGQTNPADAAESTKAVAGDQQQWCKVLVSGIPEAHGAVGRC